MSTSIPLFVLVSINDERESSSTSESLSITPGATMTSVESSEIVYESFEAVGASFIGLTVSVTVASLLLSVPLFAT